MRSAILILLGMSLPTCFFLTSAVHSQTASKTRAAASSSVLRMEAVQSQIEKQQTEIDALQQRLATLQREYEDLAEEIADQSSNSDDDDDDADIPDVPFLRVHTIGKANRSATPAGWPLTAVCIDETKSNHRYRRVR